MIKLLWIAAGGGVGAVLRYLVAGWVQRLAGEGTFPAGTLAVNGIGCLVIGLLSAAWAGPHLIREEYRMAVLVGVLGGFTTFSTFGWETFALLNEGDWARAALNVLGSLTLALLAVWSGYRLGELTFGV